MRAVVANVDVETIHDVVVRISKQPLHRCVFDDAIHAFGNEGAEIGGGREGGDIV